MVSSPITALLSAVINSVWVTSCGSGPGGLCFPSGRQYLGPVRTAVLLEKSSDSPCLYRWLWSETSFLFERGFIAYYPLKRRFCGSVRSPEPPGGIAGVRERSSVRVGCRKRSKKLRNLEIAVSRAAFPSVLTGRLRPTRFWYWPARFWRNVGHIQDFMWRRNSVPVQ